MKIRFLGAHNLVTNTTRTMTLLVDGVIALDAGCLASALSFKAQRQIHSVLLTHAHYDHTRDIPAFAMNLFLGG